MVVSIRGRLLGLIFTLLAPVAVAACGDDGAAGDAGSADSGSADAVVDSSPVIDASPPPDVLVIDGTPIPPGATCQTAIPMSPGDGATGDTNLMNPTGRGSCSITSNSARDTVYHFDVGTTAKDLLVTASVDEGATPPFDVVLYARSACNTTSTEISCADSGWGESAVFLDVSDSVYVFVDGSSQFGGDNHGMFTLTSSSRDISALGEACDMASVSSRCAGGNRCVASVCVADSAALACTEATNITAALTGGGFTTTATTHQFQGDFYKGTCPADPALASPEAIYTFTVGAASTFVATTDRPGTQFDTYLYLRQGTCAGTETACHDDVDLPMQNLNSTINVADLQPGTYFLFVDGSSPGQHVGQFELDVTLTAN